jgi:hypothetical protein
MLYDQLRNVKNLVNPPRDGKAGIFCGKRAEGYADYVVGMIYVDPYACRFTEYEPLPLKQVLAR